MAINTQKFLPSSKETKVSTSFAGKSSLVPLSQTSIKNIGVIRVKVVEIDKILKGTLAIQKKDLDTKKRETSTKRREKFEEKLETKPKAEPGKISMPNLPRMGFLDWVKNFIGNAILGYFVVRLVDHLPKIVPIVKFLGKATDFVLDIGGKLLDGLVTFVDWGYKAYDATRGFVKNLFGDSGVKQFDQLSGLLNKFLNLAIIAGMAAAGSGGFGRGPKGGGSTPRRGTGGRPRVTTSGGGRAGGIDLRNPLRERPRVTTGGGSQFRLPGTAARVTTSGGKRALLSSVRPFLKNIRIPVIGALIDFGLSVALGEDPGRAAFRAIGAGILGTIGGGLAGVLGLAGGPLAVATAALGSIAGGTLGDMAGGALYDLFFGGKKPKSSTKKMAGGGITRGGKSRGRVKRSIGGRQRKRAYKRTLTPKKPGEVEVTSPGSDVGGQDKLFGIFPNPFKKVSDTYNPFKNVSSAQKNLGQSDYFGPILAITSKIILGQKPSQKDYENVGLGINALLSKGLTEGKLKGGLISAFAEGGLVDPQAISAITDGGDISSWVAKAFKDATDNNAQKTLKEIQDNLRLKKGDEQQPTQEKGGGGGSGGTAGQFSPEGLQGDIYKYLLSKGMDDIHALGIMANISRESGFRPGVSEVGGPGVGLFQYSSEPRKSNFLKAVPNYASNWKGQIDYALKESGEPGQQYLNSKFSSPQEAADWWMRKWERPREDIQNVSGPKIHREYLASLEKYRTGKGYQIPTSGDFSGMDKGGVGGSIAEYITGDPNTPFGRFDRKGHGTTDNYHDHIGFRDRNTAVKAYNFFKSKGIKVTEFKGFDPVGGHAAGSLHYSGLAFDVPGAQWGGSGAIGSRDYSGSARVRKTLKEFLGGGNIVKLEKGGLTPNGPHLALVGEKGKEFVIDADSTQAIEETFPGFLGALNEAKYKDAINVLRNFASYESESPQTIFVPLPDISQEGSEENNYYGGSVFMDSEDEFDPFNSLYMGG
jgi:hypothetical protein